MEKKPELIIVGDSAFAEVAFQYFNYDSEYQVVGFAVEKEYLSKVSMMGLPIFAVEELPLMFNPKETFFYVAVVYSELNRLRTRLYLKLKEFGFRPASYISKKAYIWPNTKIGEHVFIFEDNTIQPFVSIGDNCVLWSGNHVGHHSSIKNNCFIASHAVISGFCEIGEFTFIGVNATIANNVSIGRDNWIGLGVTIGRSTPNNELHKGPRSLPSEKSATEFFRVNE